MNIQSLRGDEVDEAIQSLSNDGWIAAAPDGAAALRSRLKPHRND